MREESPAAPVKGWPKAGSYFRKIQNESATLNIGALKADGFGFDINAYSGSHTGFINGQAIYIGDTAEYKDQESGCKLEFIPIKDGIKVKENKCSDLGGIGVYFEGEYRAENSSTKGQNCMNTKTCLAAFKIFPSSAEEGAFAELVGKYYGLFVENFQIVEEGDDVDKGAKVFSGSVRGLNTIKEKG